MSRYEIAKELERIVSVLNGCTDVIAASPFAKEHYEELIDDLLDRLQSLKSKIFKDGQYNPVDFEKISDKYNKVRGAILNLDITLTNKQFSMPYNISKEFNEIVKLVKN